MYDDSHIKDIVSIHAPPKGRDIGIYLMIHQWIGFNPRAPEGARLRSDTVARTTNEFQSTRPRRGAILCGNRSLPSARVSIHAPPKGRDGLPRQSPRSRSCFNPRAPEGARYYGIDGVDPWDEVSIHAPPKGRDRHPASPMPTCNRFNPRAPEGARSNILSSRCANSTGFNPRAPEGARFSCLLQFSRPIVFQSTRPRRGAILALQALLAALSGFNPRFNPRAPEGARSSGLVDHSDLSVVSIHAPPKGRDNIFVSSTYVVSCFNPRAPEGAR